MTVGVQSQSTGALPFQTTSVTNQTSSQNDATAGSQMNQYSGAQLALQNQALGGFAGILSGQSIPSNFNLPGARDAFMQDFTQNVEPRIAARNGAFSPAIASQLTQGLVNLNAQTGQQGFNNAMNAYNLASDYAFRPQGQNTTGTGTRTGTQETNTTDTAIDYAAILGNIQWQLANATWV